MFKWILIAAVGYALYRMLASERRKKTEKTEQENQRLVATGELVKDPVCGVYVEKESAISAREGNVVHHFCSYDCRDAFLKQHGVAPGNDGRNEGNDAQGGGN
jgi:YHS domain-containing protein